MFNFEEWYAEWSSGRKEAARKASLLQIAKDEAEYKRSKPRVASVEEDADDDGFFCEENVHLAFDPEKSPKFIC